MGFGKVLIGTFQAITRHATALLQALAWPFLALLLIDVLSQRATSIAAIVVAIVTLCLQIVVAITAIRIVLMPAGSMPAWGLRAWTWRETRFLLKFLGFGMAILALTMLTADSIAATLVGVLLIGWGVGRLCLVLPAAAADKPMTLRQAWQATANHQLLMLLVVLVVPAIFSIPVLVASLLPYSDIFISIFVNVALAAEMIALSVVYQMIQDAQPRANTPA